MKIKSILILCMVLMINFTLIANGTQDKSTDQNEKPLTLVASTINPDGSLLADAFIAYTDKIMELSDNKITITTFTGGQLGDASSLYQSVIDGSIDIIYSDPGWFAERHPEFDILEGNYLFKGKEHFISVVNDKHKLDFFKNKLLDDPGLVVLMIAGGLERDIISTYPINSIEDLKGKNMRSKSTSTNMDWWSALGANPVPVAFKETYTAVQTGVVGGSQNSLDAMISMRFAEVNSYIARTQHNISIGFIVMNKAKYEELGLDFQKILSDASDIVQPVYLEKAFETSNEKLESLIQEYGIVVTTPDTAPFIKVSRKQIEDLAAKYGIIDEINKIFE